MPHYTVQPSVNNAPISRRLAITCVVLVMMYNLVFCACCAADPFLGIQAHRTTVPLNAFLKLRAGMKKSEVDKLLGTKGEHGFTYLDDNHNVYLVAFYSIAPDQKSKYTYALDLLFRKDLLFAVRDGHDALPPPPNKEWKPPMRRDFEDASMIQEYLKHKSLRGEEIAKSRAVLKQRILDAARHYEKVVQKDNNPNPVRWAFALAGGLIVNKEKLKRKYERNAKNAKKYDPEKVMIGMTEQQVTQLYGKPRFIKDLNKSDRAVIYGPETPVIVYPEVQCSPVMVLFQKDKAIRVLSHGFFNVWWKEDIKPPKRTPIITFERK